MFTIRRLLHEKRKSDFFKSQPESLLFGSLETDDLGHGIFTYYFLKGMDGAADRDQDKVITLREVYDYVYEKVTRLSKEKGGNQHPLWKGEIKGDIVLCEIK